MVLMVSVLSMYKAIEDYRRITDTNSY